jgi:dTDP-glucose pyrophosphorylase
MVDLQKNRFGGFSMSGSTAGIILSAGKVHESLIPIFGNINTGLIPIKNKPAILYIIDQYKEKNIKDLYITVGDEKEKLIEIIKANYKDFFNFHFVETDASKKPGNSLLQVIKEINASSNCSDVLVTLADTLAFYEFEILKKQGSTILVSDDIDEHSYWCKVKTDDNGCVNGFIEKGHIEESLPALVGVYYLQNIDVLDGLNGENLEISEILGFYIRSGKKIKTHKPEKWFDTGHLSKYYKAKKEFMAARFFNSFSYNDLLSTVTKKTTNIPKLQNEILWFNNLPNEIKALTPKISNYSLYENTFIEMEYYGYPSLQELWLYGNLSAEIWKSVLERLFNILELFKKYKGCVTKEDYTEIYMHKTKERIAKILQKQDNLAFLLKQDDIIINGKKYKGWSYFEPKLESFIDFLFDKNDNTVLHGDFCFSNVLFDLNNGITRLIDPRGNWGKHILFGDIKYDIAKLRHSISGSYDFIVNDLFNYEQTENEITYNFNLYNNTHNKISILFDNMLQKQNLLEKIQLIEGLLFISMLPYHADKPDRQVLMFAKGIENLNKIN